MEKRRSFQNTLACFAVGLLLWAGILFAESGQTVQTKATVPPNTDSHADRIGMDVSLRRAFRRMEKNAHLTVTLRNESDGSLGPGTVTVSCKGQPDQSIPFAKIEKGKAQTIHVPLETELRPGQYVYHLTVTNTAGDKRKLAFQTIPIHIVARLPKRMPVIMYDRGDLEQIQKAGFTHSFVKLADCGKIWQAGTVTKADKPEGYAQNAKTLDQALIDGFGVVGHLLPASGYLNFRQKQLFQVNRMGKPYSGRQNICAMFPEVQAFGYNVGASVAQTYGMFPAFEAALGESETRDAARLCFHEHDRKAFREFAGYDIPKNVSSKTGTSYQSLRDFPRDRILRKTPPFLQYLKWFWQKGDGWNDFYTQIHRGLKSTGRNDLWTWYDPAVRVPSISGSGGGVDILSQWTYTYPDPIKIGKATDELFAMADLSSNPNQQVMKMTQAIWYRSFTAPKRKKGEHKDIPLAQWEKTKADADFITIAPDHLREAFWSKIARPIRGIMYHGWQALCDVDQDNRKITYRFTHPHSQQVLKELVDTVVTPLGPTLLQVPDPPCDIAFLQSFTSEMLAGTGEFGWGSGWSNDAYQILRYAQLQPKVVYEETVLRDKLKGVKVLVLVKCPVLTPKVASIIKGFQNRGGIIIGDEMLAPAINPDILLPSYKRIVPDKDKAALQSKALKLRSELDEVYTRQADSSNPDVLVRLRRYKTSDYLFVVNDKRTFGNYVGQYRKVMEKGLPAGAILSLDRTSGYVYDLVKHEAVPSRIRNGKLSVSVKLGPGCGKLLLITKQPIDKVTMNAPESVRRGKSFDVQVNVVDAKGKPIQAIVPLDVKILDAENKPAEFTGFYGAKDGVLNLKLDPARNDPVGKWTIQAHELASNKTTRATINVLP